MRTLMYRSGALRSLALLSAIVFLGSCTEEATTPAQTTEATLEKVESEFHEAEKQAEEVTDALTEELRDRVDDLSEMIEDLTAKAKRTKELETRLILEESAKDLEIKRTALAVKLERIEDASEEAWEKLRVELEKAFLEFKGAYDEALEKAEEANHDQE